MLFNFHLRAISDIGPFDPPRQRPLSWFWLTDGWYWMNVGDQQLFRDNPDLIKYNLQNHPDWQSYYEQEYAPYVDYYVVRLWEDILDLLPDILEPLPELLINNLLSHEVGDALPQQLQQRLENIDDDLTTDEIIDTFLAARQWWAFRHLSVGYLQRGPNISFWNDGITMYIEWDNRAILRDAIPAWSAIRGRYSLSLAQFIAEVTDFNARLMAAMAQRIAEIKVDWPRTDSTVNMDWLEQEQASRSTWLAKALEKTAQHPSTDWGNVLDAIRRIEEL